MRADGGALRARERDDVLGKTHARDCSNGVRFSQYVVPFTPPAGGRRHHRTSVFPVVSVAPFLGSDASLASDISSDISTDQ